MTILDEFIDQHKNWCWCEMSKNYMPDKCTCGKYQVAAELAALRAEIAILRKLTTYREALVKIAEIAQSWEGRSNAPYWNLGDIARAALKVHKEGDKT